jgi:predicted AAA+ superfamily ATPase
MFYRKIESKLKNWLVSPTRKPLIINGARQVGKSTVLKKFGTENFSRLHYFNFEVDNKLKILFENTLDPKEIIKSLMIERNIEINAATDLIFFDEIQVCPKALHSLKYFYENTPDYKVCAAGSLLGVQLSDDSYPVGKVDELHMFPLTFEEFLLAHGQELLIKELNLKVSEYLHLKLWEFWRLYLVVGGLPEVVSIYLNNQDQITLALTKVREKQNLIVNEYLRDMSKYSGKANALHLERIFREVPIQLARNQDSSVKRFKFVGVIPSVSQYSRFASAFDWLKAAGLIFKVPIIDLVEIPLIQHASESRFKAYLFDVGILGALADIPPKVLLDFKFDTYKGYFAENFILQELRARGIENVYCWHGSQAEVEFLVTTFSGILPIEVKAGSVKKAKSFNSYIKKFQPEKGYIFGATTPRQDGVVFREPLYRVGVVEI